MQPPHRQLDAGAVQGLLPRQHVLVDAVDQRPVEIEQEGLGTHFDADGTSTVARTVGLCSGR